MARFYGWSHDTLMGMDSVSFNSYYSSIDILECQEMLSNFNLGDWPKMKKADRTALHKKISRRAYPMSLKPKSDEELTEDVLREMMNG